MATKPRILRDFRAFPKGKASSVCLGNFDGVHRAHLKILLACLDGAKRHGEVSVVFTFEPHPSKFFTPNSAPHLLMTPQDKREYFATLGFDFILEQKFDSAFMKISAEDFLSSVLYQNLGARRVVVGPDFRYGFKASGNIAVMKKRNLFRVKTIAPVLVKKRRLSSSWIRELVTSGEIKKANRLLGHTFSLSGRVVKGFQRGRKLGFRTANIQVDQECLPKTGVYVTLTEDTASGSRFRSVTNIGMNPTFDGKKISIETHLLGFSKTIYFQKLRVFFLKRLRNERKFSSVEALKKQVAKDILSTQKYFERHSFDGLHSRGRKI